MMMKKGQGMSKDFLMYMVSEGCSPLMLLVIHRILLEGLVNFVDLI